jgi:hypothetical protein
MRTLAVALAFCAVVGAQPADDLDRLFQAHQWLDLRSAVTDRSPALMRAAVATAFYDPDTAERLLREVIRSAPASNAADEAYGMLLEIYARSGQYRRWLTTYRQWVATIPDSARARAAAEDETELARRPDQVNGHPRAAVLRHGPGDLTIPVSVGGKSTTISSTPARNSRWLIERRAARLGLKIFGIGPAEVVLRPATVTLQRIRNIGGECCVGNAGNDLIKQGTGFTIDFVAMTLRLNDAKP